MAINNNPSGKIGNQVWLDANENGLFDAGEAGIGGIQVELVGTFDNGGGSFSRTKTTNDNGRYVFSDLITGDGVTYSVNFSGLPEGFEFTQPNVGNNEGKDSDPNANGRVNNITLNPGQNRLDIDAGLVDNSGSGGSGTHCSISGQVRNDTDADGDLNDPDAGIAGVTVQLFADFDANGREDPGGPIRTVTTDANGNYTFDDVEYGRYIVREVDPNGATSTADSNGANPNRVAGINVTPQTPTITGIDFLDTFVGGGGNPSNGSISGQVRNDIDGDGNLNDPDAGLAGVTIQLALTTNPGQIIATDITDGNGNFSFDGLEDGKYIVTEINPDGFTSTADSNGFNPDKIAGINIRNGSSKTGLVFLDTADAPPPPTNSAPNARNDSDTTALNTPVTINVLGNDSDPENDPLSITSIDGQSVNPGDRVDVGNGVAILQNDGQIRFNPDTDFTGTESFSYHVSDGNGGEDTANVTVTVEPPANSDPTAVNDSETTELNTPVTIDVLGNDSDPENDPLSVTSIEGQSVSPGDSVITDNGTATLLANGQVRFTPNAGFTGNELFDYHVSDGNGGEDTATVRVTVAGVPNGAPTANNDSSSTTINTPVSIDVVNNDTDPNGDTLSVTSLNGQAVTPGGSITTDNGRVQLLANGQLSFTPKDGFVGNDVFTYHVSDGNGGESTAEVTVSVTSPPDAMDDSAVAKGGSVTIDVLANDSDPDGDTLSIKSVEDPDNGSVSIVDGQIVYTPDAGFTGADVFDYSISDGNGGHDTASVTVKSFIDLGGIGSARTQTSVAGSVVNQFTDTRIVVNTSQLNEALVRNDVKSIMSIDNLNEINQAVSDFRGGTLGRTPKQTPEGSNSIALNYSKRGTDLNQRAARAFEGELELTYMLNNGDVETGHFTFGFGDVGHRTAVVRSPIGFDLNGDGIQTLSIDDGVMFDMLNTGEAVNTGWLSGEDGFLAVDTDGDGQISDRSELFGGGVGEGFVKLASFDSNGDSVVDINDAQFGDLLVWQDANENGITDSGELTDLISAGIASINTSYTNVFETDAQGNIHGEVSTALGTDSREIQTTDVYFQVGV